MESMGKRKSIKHMWLSSSAAFSISVACLLISIAFWSDLISIAGITAKESANHVVTTIQSWKESDHSKGQYNDLLITCGNGNTYEIRYMLYEERKNEFNSVLAVGAQASIYTGFHSNRVMEISVNGHTVFPFDTGYPALLKESIGYACLAVLLDLCGILLIIYGVIKMKKNKQRSLR